MMRNRIVRLFCFFMGPLMINTNEFDIDKMNECFFASINNRIANEIVFRGWELMAKFSKEHGYFDERVEIQDSIYEQNGFVPPTNTGILNQFIDDIHKKLKKSVIL